LISYLAVAALVVQADDLALLAGRAGGDEARVEVRISDRVRRSDVEGLHVILEHAATVHQRVAVGIRLMEKKK
jgi:hypothetical protein